VVAAGSACAATYTVNSTLDLPDADLGDGVCATAPPTPVCTLRAAVMEANAHAGPDYISLPAGTYTLTRVGDDQTASLGDLDITDDVTIEGSGEGEVIVDANGSVTHDRAFEVVSGSLTLYGMTITNGNTLGYGGAIQANGNLSLDHVTVLNSFAQLGGGGIYSTGTNTQITASTFLGNVTQGSGGAIRVVGSSSPYPLVSIVDSTIAANQSLGGSGGGGVSVSTGSLVLQNAFVHDNSSTTDGGGIQYFAGVLGESLKVMDSVVDHNMAGATGVGGGLYTIGNDSIADSVFSNNSAASGAGIEAVAATHDLTDVAVTGNTASDSGGGIILLNGTVNIVRGRLNGNVAGTSGGGVFAPFPASLHITDATVYDNGAVDGGGIYDENDFSVTSSAIYHNHAQRGGGVFASTYPGNTAVATIDNSIVDGNSAGSYGGGVFVDASTALKLDSATITGNQARTAYPSAGTGGGVYVNSTATATAASSVFAYNSNSPFAISPNDCYGTLTLSGYSFVSSNSNCTVASSGSGNSVGGTYPSNIDPQLGPFERLYDRAPATPPKASPKFGRVPLAGSPLIDAGNPGGCQAGGGGSLLWDEIGQSRTLGGRCDIGAVEYGALVDSIFADPFEG
jgi:hypothetical protein